ncbi:MULTISPECIES: acetyl-CoA hydrolase/transferase C-terminal domain-containing protein [unclassified Wenzhouxiangella]|uniref:acetyl-CoA hydrolase/transferase C-terminal domain-containing protein n=1 Tax=unclassified Wenzhouxiangella TaxID=2613841 RepID=UPI000E325C27|nr:MULTISPECIES: acetyl-CoA hydrolase/transferase C-terminal domain-containing protein [unclassified Wenzhouxiangella]RFF28172.1 acetyl-CoA hydrolase/transferase family protein [Wenzhouxiangella sp. 15181]RFP67961.1 acetyl-CoA hydrolase/transferase family protein [Wenzhouxiangella sp. 15190]
MNQSTPAAYEDLIDRILERVGRRLVVGLPLGLGKPNRLVNALYRRACEDRGLQLEIVTALSLDLPESSHWLAKRLMDPAVERLFGADYPRLDYVRDQHVGSVPDNIRITEFYFQSGAALGVSLMQRHYISSNYTHVARDLVDRGINLLLQLVAGPEQGRYSLSCNPDVTLDVTKRLREEADWPWMAVAQVHPDLPFMHGDAVVEADFFDEILDEDPRQPLFPVPRASVSLQDHAVGVHASRLQADGGTLQIGIGSLSDALVNAMLHRQDDNRTYRELIGRLDAPSASFEHLGGFEKGLYGASEMFMDGFMHLYRAGILKREVFDDLQTQQRVNAGESVEQAGTGALMDGGFFLGSGEFYRFLRELDESERPRFRMHGVGRINQLYGGQEALEVAQRRHACFINTCMMVTATGAAVSDGLSDHQVVSGVGGQYNFVAMAHAMDDGRSVLMLRSTRTDSSGGTSSNIVWEYPHTTIPRHLRDLVVTEYGVAELRGRTDEECIKAMVDIMDARFQDELVEQAKKAGKLDADWTVPAAARRNTPESLEQAFADYRSMFPEYPFGSDFTEVEQRLIPALERLKRLSSDKLGLLQALLRGRPGKHAEELERLGLADPASFKERAYARLVAAMLEDGD